LQAIFAIAFFILFTLPLASQTTPGTSWPNGTSLPWVEVITTAALPVDDAAESAVVDQIDFVCTSGAPATAYMAYDGTNVFFRFQLVSDPRLNGFWSNGKRWIVDFANANGVPTGSVELFVSGYVAITVNRGLEDFFFTNNSGSSRVRVVQGSSSYFLDFQVRYSTITTQYPGINLMQPFKVFFSSGVKTPVPALHDYMQGSSVDFSIVETAFGLASISNGVFPVELTSFHAYRKAQSVQLQWNTATEINNYGFAIERSVDGAEWTERGFVAGAGTSSSPRSYCFSDDDLPLAASLSYRLRQIDRDGSCEYSPVVMVASSSSHIGITDAFPNPFNPSTTVTFTVASESDVLLTLHDAAGRRVRTVLDQQQISAGTHAVVLNAGDLASGHYFLVLSDGMQRSMRGVVLMK